MTPETTHPEIHAETALPTSASEGPPMLLGTKTVCKWLDCSERSLRRWRASGRFPPPDVRFGRMLRWYGSTVLGFIEQDQVGAARC